MRILLLLITAAMFSSCTDHEHDGLYLQGFQFKGLKDEVLKVHGEEVFLDKYSFGGSYEGETKFECEQYPDRIEINDNGTIKVLLLTDSGSLKLDDENEYQRFADFGEDFIVEPEKLAPLIRKNSSGTITMYSQKHVEKEQERLDKKSNDIPANRNNSNQDQDNNKSVMPPVKDDDFKFEGTKTFTDTEKDWKFIVTIKDDDILIKTYVGENNTAHKKNSLSEIERGHFVEDTIVTPNNRYRFRNDKLYQLNYKNGWNDYFEVTE